jgi:RNA polymerase sigma-70 factor, ECF subfamily
VDTDPLDHDFRRFVRHRDPTALAAVFDAAAPRLLLVAMHLTRDSASAEDLVQTVFLQVLRDAAGFDVRRPVMPWLLGLLEHRAADARRRAHRHHERADDALLAVSPVAATASSPPDAAASAETRQRVAEALAGMPGDYRQVLTLRLVHGIAAVDIAHSLGLPPATVRTRLSRGLQLLRSALPRGLATPALLAWLGGEALRASSGLQAVRAKVLAAAGGGAVATATGLWLLAVAALLVGLGWWGWQSAGELAQDPGTTAMVVPATVERDAPADFGPGERPAEAGAEAGARSATRVVAADPRATQLRGVVVAAESGQPLGDTQVTLFAYPNSGRLPTDWVAPEPLRTDAAGRFSLSLVPPGETGFNLEFSAPGRVLDGVWFESLREAVDIDVGAMALQLGTPLVLEVRRGGEAAAGIEVAIGLWRGGERPNGYFNHRSDRTGRIDLGHVEPGRYCYKVDFALTGALGDFDVPLQATQRLQLIALDEHPREQAITGYLADPSGTALSAIHVGYGVTMGSIAMKTDDSGRFALVRNLMTPAKVKLELPGHPDLVLIAGQEDVAWGSHDLRLVARRRADSSLRLRCIDAETGAPVTQFGATCWRDPWANRKIGSSGGGQYEMVARTEHPDGSVLLEGLPPGAAFVSVFPAAPYAECAEHGIVLDEGRENTMQVALRRPVTCTVRTTDAATGAVLAGIDVVVAKVLPIEHHALVERNIPRIDLTQGRVVRTSISGTQVLELARGITDVDGTARLVVPPDLPALVLFAEGPRCQVALRKDIVIARDGTELAIAVAVAGVVRGTVTPLAVVERFGPSPEALAELAARARNEHIDANELANQYPELHLTAVGATERIARTRLLADGSFELRSVPSGRYEAWLAVDVRLGRTHHGQRLGPLATFDVAIGAAPEPLLLEAARWLPGQIDLRVLLDGAPHHGNVRLHSDGAQLQLRSDASGRLRTDWLPPGTYHVCLDLAENWPHQLTFDPQPIVVTAGSVVEVVATCVRREVTIELRAAAGATLPANCWLMLRALDHPVPHLDWTGAKVDDRGVARFRAAPPGRLRVELMTREQFADRDRDAAVPIGELAPGATSLHCALPR